ncbi:MAG: rhomboid family intramembrane serine protease [Gemmatimonadaceae bacterium]|nr:rhomboid family intramembrane serine protease [Gemmatimonadaceae bacterium]
MRHGTAIRSPVKTRVAILACALLVLWFVFLLSSVSGGALLAFGVIPRTTTGLRGILFAPFLHGSLNHIVANSIPFAVLGSLVMLRDARQFVRVTLYGMAGAGLVSWLLGAPGSVHVGASGVIFGYLGFLILSGWYSRSFWSILLSVLVAVAWGGLVVGVMPGETGISWQAHLGGFLGGVAAARRYRTSR